MTEVPPILHSVLIRAEPERVYDTFTTSEGLDGWFTTGAEVDPRPGSEMVWRWKEWGPDKETTEDSGPVLEAVRPERFAFRWGARGHTTTIELDFEKTAEGTVIHLKHHGCRDVATALSFASGWGEALTLLKFYVEHGVTY